MHLIDLADIILDKGRVLNDKKVRQKMPLMGALPVNSKEKMNKLREECSLIK